MIKKKKMVRMNKIVGMSSQNLADPTGDYIGLTEDNRIVFFSSKADIEDSMQIHKSLIRHYPAFTIYKKLVDAHLYVFSQ